jgi:hypothetical protein
MTFVLPDRAEILTSRLDRFQGERSVEAALEDIDQSKLTNLIRDELFYSFEMLHLVLGFEPCNITPISPTLYKQKLSNPRIN